jgi:hypothetical protein
MKKLTNFKNGEITEEVVIDRLYFHKSFTSINRT